MNNYQRRTNVLTLSHLRASQSFIWFFPKKLITNPFYFFESQHKNSESPARTLIIISFVVLLFQFTIWFGKKNYTTLTLLCLFTLFHDLDLFCFWKQPLYRAIRLHKPDSPVPYNAGASCTALPFHFNVLCLSLIWDITISIQNIFFQVQFYLASLSGFQNKIQFNLPPKQMVCFIKTLEVCQQWPHLQFYLACLSGFQNKHRSICHQSR